MSLNFNSNINNNNVINNQFYCHICNQTIAATMTDTSEWSCSICSSTFVERVGQGIESFLNPPNINDDDNNNNERSNTSQLPRAAAISRTNFQRLRRDRENMAPLLREGSIMDILSDNPNAQTSRNGISIPDNDHPNMGFVVRQLSAPQDLEAITSLLLASMQANTNNPRPPIPIPLHNILRRTTGNNENPSFREFAEGIIGNIGMFAGNNMSGVSFDDILHHILMHESSHAGRPPASEDLIDSLSRIVVTDENVNDLGECNITLDQFQIGDIAVKLTCGHSYKEDSITQWLKMHNSCPVCRLPLGDPENDSDDDNECNSENESEESEENNSEENLPPLLSTESDSDIES